MNKETILSKYVTFCGKVYDFFGMFFHGKKKHTPETLKTSQKRGTWIVSLFIVFAVIGAFMDDEEEQPTNEVVESEEVVSSEAEESDTPTPVAAPVKVETSEVKKSWNYEPLISVYVCSKCATVMTGRTQPRSGKCPAYNGMHKWDCVGRKGDTVYQCSKCGAKIESQPAPKPCPCPRGLGHKWERL